jgi:hypothetical protein
MTDNQMRWAITAMRLIQYAALALMLMLLGALGVALWLIP